jgi:putative hydrolase of the HAD superfamily
MPIRGVIFDFGGVIHNMRWDVAHALEAEHGLERNTIIRTLYDSDDWRAVQVGAGDREAWRRAAHARLEEAAGRTMPPLHNQWVASWRLIEENLALVRALRPPYRLGVLSNADSTLEERMRDGLGVHDLFDDIVCSAVVGLAKPDAAVYRLAAQRLGLAVEECVFIDDTERNVTAARELGMAAVHYRVHRGDDLAAQLAELGVRAPAARG